RIDESCIDLLVELLDDLGGCVLGRANAKKGARLVARHERPTVGTSGSASERVAVVTASARSLPALMYSIEEPAPLNITWTWSPSRSISAGPELRYPT